jgi:hypothetical protein
MHDIVCTLLGAVAPTTWVAIAFTPGLAAEAEAEAEAIVTKIPVSEIAV